MYWNAATGHWESCPSDEFYDSTIEVWRTCAGSCNNLWAYRSTWFDCTAGEFFDLEQMEWVSACSSDKFTISNSKFWNKPIWRSPNYYVNTNSEEILELGTQEYPYKDVNLAFVEVFNIHSNTNRALTINLMEETYNYVEGESIMLINTTSVKIESYTSSFTSDPKRAKLIITDQALNVTTSKTQFNFMMDTSMNSKLNIFYIYRFGHI